MMFFRLGFKGGQPARVFGWQMEVHEEAKSSEDELCSWVTTINEALEK